MDRQESEGKVVNNLDLRLLHNLLTQRLFGLEASEWLWSRQIARRPATPIVVLDEFLVSEELTGLLDYTLSHHRYFASTRVIGREGEGVIDRANRRSRVLMAWSPFHDILANRIGASTTIASPWPAARRRSACSWTTWQSTSRPPVPSAGKASCTGRRPDSPNS